MHDAEAQRRSARGPIQRDGAQRSAQRDRIGQAVTQIDRRRKRGTGSERGRADQVSSWIDYEFATQRLLHDAGADVPRPLAQIGNATLMDYLGDSDGPAPLLHHVDIPPEEAQAPMLMTHLGSIIWS